MGDSLDDQIAACASVALGHAAIHCLWSAPCPPFVSPRRYVQHTVAGFVFIRAHASVTCFRLWMKKI